MCDLDGTLLDERGAPPLGVSEALLFLERAGVPLAVCTGRSHAIARRRVAAAGLRPVIVASCHGAMVVDERRGRCLRHLTMSRRRAVELAESLSADGLDVTLYSGSGPLPQESAPPVRVTRLIATGSAAAVAVARERCRRLIGAAADSAAADLVEGGSRGGGVRVERPAATTLDVRHRLATKDEGLRSICRALGVTPAAAAAAGDDVSDAAMLKVAGCGIAVGDRDGPLAGVADVVVAQPGLAACLRSLLR